MPLSCNANWVQEKPLTRSNSLWNLWWRFSAANDQTSIHATSERGLECKCKMMITTQKRKEMVTQYFYVDSNRKKPRGRGKFTIICQFTRITWVVCSVSEQRLTVKILRRSWSRSVQRENPGRSLSASSHWRRWSIYTELFVVNEKWQGSFNYTTFMCGFVVKAVIMSAGLLGLHAGNLFIVHNCQPWMQECCTSSTSERGSGGLHVDIWWSLLGTFSLWWSWKSWTTDDSRGWCFRNMR